MAVITVVTSILMNIKTLESLFSVAGRLSGTFQYSNTYSILCLICIIVLFTDENIKILNILTSLILIFGIFYSGSRTVFVLMGLTFLVLFFKIKSKKIKLTLIISVFVAVGGFIIYDFLINDFYMMSRLLKISFGESTFVGRILYWYDALPQIIKRPFGMGYMGYYFAQNSFKSGVYSVMFAHNDFLQIVLDVGFIPFILLCVAIVKTLFSKKVSFTRKLALIVFSLHIFFDFDLQFVAMFIIFILLLDWDNGKVYTTSHIEGFIFSIVVVTLVNIYFFFALFFQYIGKNELSLSLYDFNTFARVEQIKETTNLKKLEKIADATIKQNKYVSIAYSAKAKYAYSSGDFANVINYKKQAVETNYYDIAEYEDMFEMLMVGASMYKQSGDTYSYDYCEKELKKIPDYVDDALEKQSTLGKKIKDQPELEFSDEIKVYMVELGIDEN